MNVLLAAGAAVALAVVAPLTVWSERRVKAWTQLRRGPTIVQPYRDLRKLWAKQSLAPTTASPYFLLAPALAVGAVTAALLTLPLAAPDAMLGGGIGLLALGLFLTLHRFILTTQAYDTGTPFGGLGASRELFLGGLGEPVFLLVAAAVFLQRGTAAVPLEPLPAAAPATWLVVAALGFLWLAEAARIPFDNPATHLELTMVHEAMLLEANGWILAVHEWTAMLKQTLLGSLVLLLVVPFPSDPALRIPAILGAVVLLSGILALVEAAMAKVRLFRASHLLIMAALLAFLASAVTYLKRGPA